MNWSVSSSPPLITAALTRMATTRAIIAQNSLVLNEALVSVVSLRARRTTPSERPEPTPRVASAVAIEATSSWVGVDGSIRATHSAVRGLQALRRVLREAVPRTGPSQPLDPSDPRRSFPQTHRDLVGVPLEGESGPTARGAGRPRGPTCGSVA